MAESIACLNVLNGTNANSTPTTFNNGNGKIYILDGAECWSAVFQDIDAQLELAYAGIAVLESLHLPTESVQAAVDEVAVAKDYSTGLMIFSQWQWDQSLLEDGDQVGMCFYQESGTRTENAAQCWAYIYDSGSYDSGSSYQIRPSTIGSNTTLKDFVSLDVSHPVGTAGTWMMTSPTTAFGTTKIAFTAKFSPKISERDDPTIKSGDAEVVTYITSRTARTNAAESALFAGAERRLGQSFDSSSKWDQESVVLSCYDDVSCQTTSKPTTTPAGASAVTTVATILAACVAALVF